MIKSYMFLDPLPLLALIVLTTILEDDNHHVYNAVQEDIDDEDIGKDDSDKLASLEAMFF